MAPTPIVKKMLLKIRADQFGSERAWQTGAESVKTIKARANERIRMRAERVKKEQEEIARANERLRGRAKRVRGEQEELAKARIKAARLAKEVRPILADIKTDYDKYQQALRRGNKNEAEQLHEKLSQSCGKINRLARTDRSFRTHDLTTAGVISDFCHLVSGEAFTIHGFIELQKESMDSRQFQRGMAEDPSYRATVIKTIKNLSSVLDAAEKKGIIQGSESKHGEETLEELRRQRIEERRRRGLPDVP
ncbi:MAG: hypothetical protein V1911_03745 [Candidatus Micrarchaeota archaeon]